MLNLVYLSWVLLENASWSQSLCLFLHPTRPLTLKSQPSVVVVAVATATGNTLRIRVQGLVVSENRGP